MDIEIKIGRTVDGTNAIRVPESFPKVSRNHATIRWSEGSVTIEDNGSTNGTYVNGRRVGIATITKNDEVWLGGCGRDSQCYQLDLRSIFEKFPQQRPGQGYISSSGEGRVQDVRIDSQRTDYTAEFASLKRAYIEYHEQMSKLKKKASNKMLLPRILVSSVPALLGVVVMILSKDMTMRIVAMSAGSVLSGLLGTLIMGRGSASNEKMTEKILDLQLKYQKEYRCPKCGKEYSLEGMHWKKLQADGKCPYGCGARFN